jgi:hypothetical protein
VTVTVGEGDFFFGGRRCGSGLRIGILGLGYTDAKNAQQGPYKARGKAITGGGGVKSPGRTPCRHGPPARPCRPSVGPGKETGKGFSWVKLLVADEKRKKMRNDYQFLQPRVCPRNVFGVKCFSGSGIRDRKIHPEFLACPHWQQGSYRKNNKLSNILRSPDIGSSACLPPLGGHRYLHTLKFLRPQVGHTCPTSSR